MTNSAILEPRELARQLLAHELSLGQPSDATDSLAFRVCDKLRQPLGKLTGVGGFRSLLSRALALAGAEVPWLRALHIKADGSLEGLDALEAKLGASAVAEGEVVLMSHLLALLFTFIGTGLTLQLLHDIWPKLDDLKF